MADPSLTGPYGPWALVLGASEGLGAAWADGLAARGLDVVLVARTRSKLEDTAAAIRSRHGVQTRVIPTDLGDVDAVHALFEATAELDVGLVVYNACVSTVARFEDTSLEAKLAMLDVNARGPLVVAHLWGPRLAARRRAAFVQMSSLASFQGSAWVGTYAATKAFDTVLGEALWAEWRDHDVDVLVCAAGATRTPGFDSVTPADRRAGTRPMQADAVVDEAIAALQRGQGPTVVAGAFNRFAHLVMGRLLPRRTAVSILTRETSKLYASRGAP